ncbi:endonuclease I family protein [Oceanobacillus longus]|uniref:Endonuclease I family protein n=1 Tax=Oceanobacillus longus TaxID=930120 RepID=A0ABV8H0D5_9BACI
MPKNIKGILLLLILFIILVLLFSKPLYTTFINVSTGEIPLSLLEADPKTPPTDDYYEAASGKSGEELKAALHNIIDDHTEISYSNVWEALRETDEDPSNSSNVILLYTGRSQGEYENGGNTDNWNREHVWAKSHGDFGTATGAGTDLHHLRPTDVSINSARSNFDFDEGGREHIEADGNYYDSDSWEPRDNVKGDVARMLFYMDVRYEGDSGELNLELNDQVNNGSEPYHGRLSVLLEWHEADPVDDFERRRNEIIYNDYQHNRNPFIDHPEWAVEIWE